MPVWLIDASFMLSGLNARLVITVGIVKVNGKPTCCFDSTFQTKICVARQVLPSEEYWLHRPDPTSVPSGLKARALFGVFGRIFVGSGNRLGCRLAPILHSHTPSLFEVTSIRPSVLNAAFPRTFPSRMRG